MPQILIFGNSGSGKSTLAKKLSEEGSLAHLDLDTLAWENSNPPQRKPLTVSANEITDFIQHNENWIIEGCYTDLLEIADPYSNEIIFLNLNKEMCIANARNRPWEPHKYKSKEDQDANLEMLVDWISQYSEREDTFSENAHREFYDNYKAKKRMILENE